jgi:hypothetical protein
MAQLLMVNPRKRRKAKAKTSTRRRRSYGGLLARAKSAISRSRRRYRRNPIGGIGGTAMTQFKDGAIGAVGALAVDVIFAKLPIPANLKTGVLKPITQGLIGVGVGMAVAKFVKNRALGHKLAQGAVTISLYNAGKAMVGPSLGLSGYDDSGMLGYDDSGMLGYSELNGMGWVSPAQVSQPYESMDGFDDFTD